MTSERPSPAELLARALGVTPEPESTSREGPGEKKVGGPDETPADPAH